MYMGLLSRTLIYIFYHQASTARCRARATSFALFSDTSAALCAMASAC
eukprot:SAG25_NODE_3893_length_936_cov_4.113501_1_plen_47_part_10